MTIESIARFWSTGGELSKMQNGLDENRQQAELEALAGMASSDESLAEYVPGIESDEIDGASSAEMMTQILALSFGIVAMRAGDHWCLSSEEAEKLGEAYGAVFDKYFPGMKAGPEVTAIVLTGMVVAPRLIADRANSKQSADHDERRDGGDQAE